MLPSEPPNIIIKANFSIFWVLVSSQKSQKLLKLLLMSLNYNKFFDQKK